MGQVLIRDPSGAEFEIDSSALPFWADREGYKVLGPVEEPTPEPVADSAEPAESGGPTPAKTAKPPKTVAAE